MIADYFLKRSGSSHAVPANEKAAVWHTLFLVPIWWAHSGPPCPSQATVTLSLPLSLHGSVGEGSVCLPFRLLCRPPSTKPGGRRESSLCQSPQPLHLSKLRPSPLDTNSPASSPPVGTCQSAFGLYSLAALSTAGKQAAGVHPLLSGPCH